MPTHPSPAPSTIRELGYALDFDLSAGLYLDGTLPALGSPNPGSLGLVAWNGDPVAFANNTVGVSGTIYLARVDVARQAVITKIYCGIVTVATTPTASQNKLGLLDANGTLLGEGDITSQVTSQGLVTAAITAVSINPGMYYVGLLQNASTPAAFARGSGSSLNIMNAGQSAAATLRWCTNGTSQTDITNRTLSSNSISGASPFWTAIGA